MEYTLKFTEQQIAVLDRALQDLPFKFAAPLIKTINEQLVSQRKEADASEAPEEGR